MRQHFQKNLYNLKQQMKFNTSKISEKSIAKNYRSLIVILDDTQSQNENDFQQIERNCAQRNLNSRKSHKYVKKVDPKPKRNHIDIQQSDPQNSKTKKIKKNSKPQNRLSRFLTEDDSQQLVDLENLPQEDIEEQNSNYSIDENHILYRKENTHSPAKQNNFDSKCRNMLSIIEQNDRIMRSKNQKICLQKVIRIKDQSWTFEILGTQKIPYFVEIRRKSLCQPGDKYCYMTTCTCFDFNRNYKPCKHIYFVITQVARDESQLLPQLSDNIELTKRQYHSLDRLLIKRLRQRLQQQEIFLLEPQDNSEKEENQQDCAICYIQMDHEADLLHKCSTCQKHFHLQCINKWKQLKNTCPLCRSSFSSPRIIREPET